MNEEFPFVFIDDDPESAEPELRHALGDDALWIVRYPHDFQNDGGVTENRIRNCKVVLMDLQIRENVGWGLDPSTGQALVESIRGYLAGDGNPLEADKTAFVLFSSLLERISDNLPVQGREHVLARKSGNEWVMDKVPNKRPESQHDLRVLSELSDAVRYIEGLGPDDQEGAKRSSLGILGIDDPEADDWRSSAAEDAEKMGLPIQSIMSGHGMSLVRWLLHVSMPFPGALCEIRDLAVALRLAPEQVRNNQEFVEALNKGFNAYRYQGILPEFNGPRWWRAGVSDFIYNTRKYMEENEIAFHNALNKLLGYDVSEFEKIEYSDPVLVVDECYRLTDKYCDVSETVRIAPDDWPDEVMYPRIQISETTKSTRIKELVRPEDVYRLDD